MVAACFRDAKLYSLFVIILAHLKYLLQILPDTPLLNDLLRNILDKNMNMIQPSHTLQTDPILEPLHPLLPSLQISNKVPLHKIFDELP